MLEISYATYKAVGLHTQIIFLASRIKGQENISRIDMTEPALKEGIDYVTDEQGNFVLTKKYLLSRGYCCQSGCLNCPYDYHTKVDPNIPAELQDPWGNNEQILSDPEDDYDPNE
jgi:hypothetical protein